MISPIPPIIWFCGLPSSGKSTLSIALRDALKALGQTVCVLDGDALRHGVCNDLGFSDEDRSENLRRAAHLAALLSDQGHRVIAAFVTPKEIHRELIRSILGDRLFLVHVDCPLSVCQTRDVKGLYQRAATQTMQGLTGPQDPFEPCKTADLVLRSDQRDVDACLRAILDQPGVA